MYAKHWLSVLAVVAVTAAGACSDKKSGQAAETALQVAACAQAIESAVHVQGLEKVQTVATGCAPACPSLAAYGASVWPSLDEVTELFAGCRLFCTDRARDAWMQAATGDKFSVLVRECGPETYGLVPSATPLLSDSWAVLLRVHDWLETNRIHADKSTRATLERAGMHAHFLLPLPVKLDGMYTLAESRVGKPSAAAFYMIVPRGDAAPIRAGAVPVVRLRPGELERRPVPGGEFPGKELRAPVREYADFVRILEGLHPGAGHKAIDSSPLLLADRDARVSALVRTTAAVGQTRFRLAVADRVAMEHPVQLELLTTTGSAAPVIKILRDEIIVLGGDMDIHITAGPNARERLAAELSDLSVRWAPQDKIEISLPGSATVTELGEWLDLIYRTQFRSVLLRPVEDASNPAR